MRDLAPLSVVPIGIVHSPFRERLAAPRQPGAGGAAEGRIELFGDDRFVYALEDLEKWSHLWVIFWFHLNAAWKPKVRPPRSVTKRGVFATRAPHRPNPIGLSAVELLRIEGLDLIVRNLDILDGSPVLDIKPYVPYTDAIAGNHGWLGERVEDSGPAFSVTFSDHARTQLLWLRERHGVELEEDVERILSIGVSPHPYRRIKQDEAGMRLAVRDWRFRFSVDGSTVTVSRVLSGYRPRVLNDPRSVATAPTPLDVHRAFVARFG